jgi:hypothetical protein
MHYLLVEGEALFVGSPILMHIHSSSFLSVIPLPTFSLFRSLLTTPFLHLLTSSFFAPYSDGIVNAGPIFLLIYRALLQTRWLRYRLTNPHVRLHHLRPSQAKAHQFLLPRPSVIWWDYVDSSSTVSFSSGHCVWVKCKRGAQGARQARVEWAHLTLPKSPAYRSRCAGAVAIVKSDTREEWKGG